MKASHKECSANSSAAPRISFANEPFLAIPGKMMMGVIVHGK